ncbi:hypothetical protein EON63_17535 [archaeon]|nr:MAG: hypothetical protein EON63_17535 [archaeon]
MYVKHVIRCLLPESEIPLNQGCLAPIQLCIPKNSLLSPSPQVCRNICRFSLTYCMSLNHTPYSYTVIMYAVIMIKHHTIHHVISMPYLIHISYVSTNPIMCVFHSGSCGGR